LSRPTGPASSRPIRASDIGSRLRVWSGQRSGGTRVPSRNLDEHRPDLHARFTAADLRSDFLVQTRVQLSVLISRWRLDRDLADGVDPCVSKTHALRARQLTDARGRRQLARSLRHAVSDADGPSRLSQQAAVPPSRGPVIACREGLLGIADLLEGPGPLNACGVARIRSLITDGLGPLYCERAECSLLDALWWVADGVQKCPPHTWASPVTMKFDPEHVAWTCSRCGAVSTSDDRSVKPA
jgi:hypothetical protein